MNILIIEDNPDLLQAVSETLENDSRTLTTCLTVEEAKNVLNQNSIFDLIISDFQLEQYDCSYVLEHLKKNDKFIPTIIYSASPKCSIDSKIDYPALVAILSKPCSYLDEIVTAISNYRGCYDFAG